MTEAKPRRSIPSVRLTDAEAGAAEFPSSESREFNYYKPRKRRRTLYEDVTVDVQPDPNRHLLQGWLYSFADGTAGYSLNWTKLKSSDWHAFRDPNEEWERTIYAYNSDVEEQIQQNIESAKIENAFQQWNGNWVQMVAKHVSAWMHPEHGLGMEVFLATQRDAPTNMINNAIAVNSTHKLRFAQDIALYNLELSEQIPEFDGSVHKDIWLNDPHWQGVRENVERMFELKDWAEAIFAANIIFEPLVGELFRSQFVMQLAAPHGDFVTPTLFGVAERDYERDLRWTRELFRMLAEDSGKKDQEQDLLIYSDKHPERKGSLSWAPKLYGLLEPTELEQAYGEENKKIMQEWLRKWIPYSVAAARQLQPLWSQSSVKAVRFEDAFDRVRTRFLNLLSDLRLELPKEVQL